MSDAIEIEAMLIRHSAAVKLLGDEDPYTLLLSVILPSEPVLEASLQAAREKGATSLAKSLTGVSESAPTRPKGRSRRVLPKEVTLDELLAFHS